jgi:VIT1/CCC1 family predicted Fe2+/Mn2+ transporter
MLQIRILRRSWPQALIALLALAVDAPALAGSGPGVAIPDPSAATLLALGVLGVIVGRYGGKRPPQD